MAELNINFEVSVASTQMPERSESAVPTMEDRMGQATIEALESYLEESVTEWILHNTDLGDITVKASVL